jgi:hypothetical protein
MKSFPLLLAFTLLQIALVRSMQLPSFPDSYKVDVSYNSIDKGYTTAYTEYYHRSNTSNAVELLRLEGMQAWR